MDAGGIVLTVSLSTALAIASVVIAILGYRLNKKKQDEAELQKALDAKEKEDTEKANIALQLLEIRKDLARISERQEEQITSSRDHEKRIQALEAKCHSRPRKRTVN